VPPLRLKPKLVIFRRLQLIPRKPFKPVPPALFTMPWNDTFIHDTNVQFAGPIVPLATAAVCALGIVLLVWRRRCLIGTTLVGPWWWCVAALLAVGVVEPSVFFSGAPSGADAWRFMAAAGVFCPAISLLGAKRPQDRAWHFVVASLWGVLALPGIEAALLRPGEPPAMGDFRGYFLLALVGLSLLIFLPTRHWPTAVLVGMGQLALVWNYLPAIAKIPGDVATLCGTGLLAAAILVALRPKRRISAIPFDRLWLDFRDSFGALWAARVLERVNADAATSGWPLRLGWNGFHSADANAVKADIPAVMEPALRQEMSNLLRRFVSPEWIAARLSKDA
jgi:hypothetical protein